jgi:transposase
MLVVPAEVEVIMVLRACVQWDPGHPGSTVDCRQALSGARARTAEFICKDALPASATAELLSNEVKKEVAMQVIYPQCAGLDVHKKTVVACRVRTPSCGPVQRETRTFATMTDDLLQLLEWLQAWGCTHVAMESTGVYWKPVYNILEGNLEILLVNAQHCKNVPGRKTDVKDAEWLADLLRHGLLRASFVPPQPQRDLRELTRGRSILVADRARLLNRLQGVLESANIKLASVVSQIDGVSARAMLEALVAGTATPEAMADLGRGKLREKRGQLLRALDGLVREHHRFLLAQLLTQEDFLEEQIAVFDAEIHTHIATLSGAGVEPGEGSRSGKDPGEGGGTEPAPRRPLPPAEPVTYAQGVELLDGIPGIAVRNAEVILAETGVDMHRFENANRLSAWSGTAPGNHVSAGKRKTGRTTPGNPVLRQALIQAAHGAIRTKGSYFGALYHRLAGRRGKRRALVAVARSLLTVIFHVLYYHEPYRELGALYFDERKKDSVVHGMLTRLRKLGYEAQLQPVAA